MSSSTDSTDPVIRVTEIREANSYCSRMKQRCYLAAIYLNWLVLAGGEVFFLLKGSYGWALAWLVFVPLGLWIYVRSFPSISRAMGYGRVDDHPAEDLPHAAANLQYEAPDVTLYTALGCPFCPIVKKRLKALREQVNFNLRVVDVTLHPGVLAEKHVRAVPVVEMGDRRIEGNATSKQLAELVRAKTNPLPVA